VESTLINCPCCGAGILLMRSLNGRKVVVDVASVDQLLCRMIEGRLLFDRSAGHVLHSTTCKDKRRFDANFVIDEERRRTFRESTQKQVKAVVVPHVAAYRELQLDITASPQMVKSAYRKLAFEYHPDRNPMGLERIQKINQAYDVLKRSGRV
jgi:DnaJ domain